MASSRSRVFPVLTITLLAGAAQGQLIETQYDHPSLDRWMYPFNGSPGTRFEMTAFGAALTEGFDDHDAQILVGFDTSTQYTPSLGSDQYQVLSITVTMTVSNDNGFVYDDSYDSYTTYGELSAPIFDLDDGRPINLFLPGYRDGYTQETFHENTIFGLVPEVAPAQGMRHAFAAIFDGDGVALDISNQIKEQFEAVPLAIGTTDSVNPGSLVPADTTFSFSFSPCDLGSGDELARMLDRGEVRFFVTSLAPATGGPDGGEGNYPIFYSDENPIAQIFGYSATLDISARIGAPGDYNGDGERDFLDISGFLGDFGNHAIGADLNGDCEFDFLDISAFLASYSGA